MKKLFITATDTDAGKTFVACALAYKFANKAKVLAFKPISAGCDLVNGQLINEDARLLAHYCAANQPIASVNPIAFLEPIAPHIAAEKNNQHISIAEISSHFQDIENQRPDYIITEGAGGWRLPLGNNEFLSSFAQQTNQSVILVVNMKLGCLNHARLTYESIVNDGLNCVGWVANCIDDMLYQGENLAELKHLVEAPCLGVIPRCESLEEAAQYLDITLLS